MLYKRLHDLRQDNDLSQNDLAEYLHISQRTYSYYERGERSIPIEILTKLAKFYHTSIDYLVDQTDKK